MAYTTIGSLSTLHRLSLRSRSLAAKACRPAAALLATALFGAAAWAQGPAASAPAAPFAQARFSQVLGGGGVPLNVVDLGDPSLPAVVLVHGYRQSYLSWTPQFASDLSTRCRLVAFDLRGHGNSGAPSTPEAYDHSQPWAEDVAQVIAQLGLKRPLIVGWSFGGNVAMDFAHHYPKADVAGYLLTGTAGGTSAVASSPANVPLQRDLARHIATVDAGVQLLFSNPALAPTLRAQFAAAAMRVGPWVDQGVMRRARTPAPDVAAPLTFVTGGKDPLVGAETLTRLKDSFPRARFIDIAGAGHAVFLDEPARFNALLDEMQCRNSAG